MTVIAETGAAVRERLRVVGVVQGVGFRPFVYGLAHSLGLAGFVGNDSGGVFVEVEGDPADIHEFHRRLLVESPVLASVDGVNTRRLPALGGTGFTIVESVSSVRRPATVALVPPDVAACDDCLAEIADPADRRYRYPFGNCTNCGPRFTVIETTPYDRANTTMAGFALCDHCAAERADPLDRRFHAEPTACPACGPTLALGENRGEAALQAARLLIRDNAIIAVKGLGGYHLVCDATSATAIDTLRVRKHRPHKPFALLVADLETASALAFVDDAEAALLSSPARPIVLLRCRPDSPLPVGIAPGLDEVGIQLPSTPLHTLLVEQPGPVALVLTSGNLADEPLAFHDADAAMRLPEIADSFLTHDRPIHTGCDDSVARVVDGTPLLLRRSRGYAPLPIRLPRPVRPVLAVGGDLKGAICLAAGQQAWPGQHLGDLGSWEGTAALEAAAHNLVTLLRIRPEVIAADRHPGYASLRVAQRLAAHWGIPLVQVQHHHAHITSAMAENQIDEPVIGVAFDGTGYGCDESIWGGELLLVEPGASAVRVGHLTPIQLPGGDAAVRRPARSALAHLAAAGIAWEEDLAPVAASDTVELGLVRRQLDTGFGCVETSSVGRLYDAVASLCAIRHDVTYEAQGALELEALSRRVVDGGYRFDVADGVFDAAPVIRAIVADLRAAAGPAAVGARFTASLADAVTDTATVAAVSAGLTTVVLAGGVFANVALLRRTRLGLAARGLRVVAARQVPCGDGGLSLGQAVVAGYEKAGVSCV